MKKLHVHGFFSRHRSLLKMTACLLLVSLQGVFPALAAGEEVHEMSVNKVQQSTITAKGTVVDTNEKPFSMQPSKEKDATWPYQVHFDGTRPLIEPSC